MDGKRDALEYICLSELSLRILFVGGIFGFIITAVSLVTFQPGSGPYVVSVLNLFGVAFVIAFSGGFLWKCNQIRV